MKGQTSTMQIKLNAIYEKVKNGYIGYVEELPGVTPRVQPFEKPNTILKKPSNWSYNHTGSLTKKKTPESR